MPSCEFQQRCKHKATETSLAVAEVSDTSLTGRITVQLCVDFHPMTRDSGPETPPNPWKSFSQDVTCVEKRKNEVMPCDVIEVSGMDEDVVFLQQGDR